ncbi:MAG: hypothetical protein KF724_12970 [Phycisphaeraceae bacterium]|nr:hypothetical protein [Phycisphaeraceae bacterium]
MDAPHRRHGPAAPDLDPADAFTDISRILARAAIRLANRRRCIELAPSRGLRLSVSTGAATNAAVKETS